MTDKHDVNISIDTPAGSFKFEDMEFPDGKYVFYPFDFDLDGITLVTATAQLLCKIKNSGETTYFFFCDKSEKPVYRLKSDEIEYISSSNNHRLKGSIWEIAVDNHDFNTKIAISLTTGKIVNIVTISRRDALNAWKFTIKNKEYLVISNACFFTKNDEISIVSYERQLPVQVFPSDKTFTVKNADFLYKKAAGDFTKFLIAFEKETVSPSCSLLDRQQKDGKIVCSLLVNRSQGGSVDDDVLTIGFEGDKARLYIDGRYCADWFYFGPEWKIGLKRFGQTEKSRITLEIEPLKSDDYVFLEKKPPYKNSVACDLSGMEIKPEYRCKIKF